MLHSTSVTQVLQPSHAQQHALQDAVDTYSEIRRSLHNVGASSLEFRHPLHEIGDTSSEFERSATLPTRLLNLDDRCATSVACILNGALRNAHSCRCVKQKKAALLLLQQHPPMLSLRRFLANSIRGCSQKLLSIRIYESGNKNMKHHVASSPSIANDSKCCCIVGGSIVLRVRCAIPTLRVVAWQCLAPAIFSSAAGLSHCVHTNQDGN